MADEPTTPMLDKISKIHEISQPLGEFMDWLHENQKIHFMRPAHMHGGDGNVEFMEMDDCRDPEDCRAYRDIMVQVLTPTRELLARFFNIDLIQADVERELLLNHFRHQETSNESI